jgi:large subunit ribosomal protein L18
MANLVGRERRKQRIRKKITGTTAQPRLSVFRSLNHIYAQVIDDSTGRTLAAASSAKAAPAEEAHKIGSASAVGVAIAEACKAKGIEKVVFDRNGYLYTGRIRALADGARKGGLQF